MDFVTTMFEGLQEIVTAVGSLIGEVFQSVVNLVYTPGADGTGGSLTIVGVLLLIGVAVGLFFFVFRWVRGLIRIRGQVFLFLQRFGGIV